MNYSIAHCAICGRPASDALSCTQCGCTFKPETILITDESCPECGSDELEWMLLCDDCFQAIGNVRFGRCVRRYGQQRQEARL